MAILCSHCFLQDFRSSQILLNRRASKSLSSHHSSFATDPTGPLRTPESRSPWSARSDLVTCEREYMPLASQGAMGGVEFPLRVPAVYANSQQKAGDHFLKMACFMSDLQQPGMTGTVQVHVAKVNFNGPIKNSRIFCLPCESEPCDTFCCAAPRRQGATWFVQRLAGIPASQSRAAACCVMSNVHLLRHGWPS